MEKLGSIMTRLQADVKEIVALFPAALRDLFSKMSRPSLESVRLQFNGSLSPGAKRSACEAEHSSPSNAKAKSNWSYTSTPWPTRGCCAMKQKNSSAAVDCESVTNYRMHKPTCLKKINNEYY
jgi:hypothetical protein